MHFSNEKMHYYYFALKNSYGSLTFAKIVLSQYSKHVSNMSLSDFEETIRSFTENERLKDITTAVYPTIK